VLRLDRRADPQARRGSSWRRLTPRRPRGVWSQRNVANVARLEAAGPMLPAGRAAVDAAKADGRWTAAYAPPSEAEVQADLRAAIAADPAAQAMFDVLTKPTASPSSAGSMRSSGPRRAPGRSPSAWRCWPGTRRPTRSEPGRRTRQRRDGVSAGTDNPPRLAHPCDAHVGLPPILARPLRPTTALTRPGHRAYASTDAHRTAGTLARWDADPEHRHCARVDGTRHHRVQENHPLSGRTVMDGLDRVRASAASCPEAARAAVTLGS
jgi:hypothetical protein